MISLSTEESPETILEDTLENVNQPSGNAPLLKDAKIYHVGIRAIKYPVKNIILVILGIILIVSMLIFIMREYKIL